MAAPPGASGPPESGSSRKTGTEGPGESPVRPNVAHLRPARSRITAVRGLSRYSETAVIRDDPVFPDTGCFVYRAEILVSSIDIKDLFRL